MIWRWRQWHWDIRSVIHIDRTAMVEEGMQDCDNNFAYPWSWWIFNGTTISSILITASIKYPIGDIITGSVWVWHYELMALQCDIHTAMRDNVIWCTESFESCALYLWILHLKEWYICKMVCIFCDIHINNIVLSSFVFSLQYLHHKKLKQNKSTCNWHFGKCPGYNFV